MNTLIKWPGGKKNEIKYIKDLIPEFENYIEPFFGGGALFFDLNPKKSYINDYSTDLILFYRLINDKKKNKQLKNKMNNYIEYWDYFLEITKKTEKTILEIYYQYKNKKINEDQLKENISNFIEKKENILFFKLPTDLYFDKNSYIKEIKKSLVNKLKRISIIEKKTSFSSEELKENIETAFRSAFYMYERNVFNLIRKNKINISDIDKVANYYFIREYCYGSMFRYNQNGDFNIPYGGMSYNKKNFKVKVDRLFSKEVKKIFKNTTIENLDFEDFLNKYKFSKNDFIFFDPPYDSNFSDYDLNKFTNEDQKRLARCIYDLDAKFILIIKNTDLIWDLYSNKKNIFIERFDKSYNYNIKGRNDRNVSHLIIHNL